MSKPIARPKPTWPTDDDLRMLERESLEHRRAWAIVHGLAVRYRAERANGPANERPMLEKIKNQVEMIRLLQEKVLHQKDFLRKIEECRVFELESEKLLAQAILQIGDILAGPGTLTDRNKLAMTFAADTMLFHARRKGPRPPEATMDEPWQAKVLEDVMRQGDLLIQTKP